MSDLIVPTCEFIGGPWDGRRHFYMTLGVCFYVPDSPTCASIALSNEQLLYVRGERNHLYERAAVNFEGSQVKLVKYLYKGIV